MEQYKERVESVIDYATSVHICRSRLLLRYFGERSSANCGHCDVCLERKKTHLSDEDFETIETVIQRELLKSPKSVDDLLSSLTFPSEKVWKVLRWLEDANVVAENEEGFLEWLVKT